MSFVVDIPSVFTKASQVPVRVGNTMLTGNENIQGSLSVIGSLTLNDTIVSDDNVVYYDTFDISSNLNIGGNTAITGTINSNTINTTNLEVSDSYIHSNTTKPVTIVNNNTGNTGIEVRSSNNFYGSIRQRPNLIQWRNNDTIYAAIYLKTSVNALSVGNTNVSLVFYTLNDTNFGIRMRISSGGRLTTSGISQSSDDRIKTDEQYISNAVETLTKLRPQTYHKYQSMDTSGDYVFESGLVAQEIYYDAPELRHLVHSDADISGHITSDDPSLDPDYSSWGPNPASVNYIGLIPYCIQSIKEQQDMINHQREIIQKEEPYNDLLARIQALENKKIHHVQ